jgi:hypothetical protein
MISVEEALPSERTRGARGGRKRMYWIRGTTPSGRITTVRILAKSRAEAEERARGVLEQLPPGMHPA